MDSDYRAKQIISFMPFILALFTLIGFINQVPIVWNNISSNLLPDSDDVMRVLQVRAWIEGQGFWDLLNHRANPPSGSEMHWSRVSDIPLASLILILDLFFSKELSQQIAIFSTPLILAGLFIFIAMKIGSKLYNSHIVSAAIIAFFLSNTVLRDNFVPGRVDHHGLQLIGFLIGIYGVLIGKWRGGLLLGFAIGFGLTIGFELMPVQLVLVLAFVLKWLFSPNDNQTAIFGFGLSASFFVLLGWFINVPIDQFAVPTNDRLSIAQGVPILFGAIGLLFCAKVFTNKAISIRFAALAILLLIVIAIVSQFKILFAPLYYQIGPIFRQMWFNDVGETFPLLKFPIVMQVSIGLFAVIATIASIWKTYLVSKKKSVGDLDNWLVLTALLVLTCLLTIFFQTRLVGQLSAISIITSGVIVGEAFSRLKIIQMLGVFAILNPTIGDLMLPVAKLIGPQKKSEIVFGEKIRCRSKHDFAALAKEEKGLVLTNISMGIETLLSTPHDVVATHFHRDKGRELAYNVFLASPETADGLLKYAGINYIAFCDRQTETQNFKKYAPSSLYAQLASGNIPLYLEDTSDRKNSDIRVFRFKK